MKLLLSVDTEADFWKYIQAPFGSLSKMYKVKWHLNKIRGSFNYAKNRQGFLNILNFFKKNKIPATFNVVGHLYLKSCGGWPHFRELKPQAGWFFKKDWYYWDSSSNYKKTPGLYLGDILEQEKKNKLFDFGVHSFAHECLPLEKKEVAEMSIKAAIKAASQIGIKPVSFSSPFNITEDKKNPLTLYKVLKENGIKVGRYMGQDDYPRGYNHQFKVTPPFKKCGLILINGSNYFEGTSSKQHLKEVLADIRENIGNDEAIYCLSCHDFTFRTDKNLKFIFKEVLKLRGKQKISIINMRSLVQGKK